jgi:hypothetical protein
MNEIAAVRKQILAAFEGVARPTKKRLVTEQGPRDAPGAARIAAELAGTPWQELSFEFLKQRWASFCYLTPEATRYYLPALLVTALDRMHERGFVHSVVYGRLNLSAYAVYYSGGDAQFEALGKLLSPGQFHAVAAFLGLFLNEDKPDHMTFLASRAMRLFWGRAGGRDASNFAAFDWKMRHFEYPVPADPKRAALADEIRAAFAQAPYPGDHNLSGSAQGDEAAEIALDLCGVDWRTISPQLLEENSSATSFLTDEGLRYFMPALLMIDLIGEDEGYEIDPVYALTSFANKADAHDQEIDWFDYGVQRMAGFTHGERLAIIHYLEYVAEQNEYAAPEIGEALERYWRPSLDATYDFGVSEETK